MLNDVGCGLKKSIMSLGSCGEYGCSGLPSILAMVSSSYIPECYVRQGTIGAIYLNAHGTNLIPRFDPCNCGWLA